MPNKLYYGDNYEVLQRYILTESVDLIYLDPPFNSRKDYNVLFAEKDGSKSSSQFHAFEDAWEWNIDAERSYHHIVENIGGRVADAMRAFRTFLGNSDMMAYLAMMAPRLIELKRVLKVTGSIYLHCDPTASHYLKVLMDAVFGGQNFGNEITWKRTFAHGNVARNYGSVSDVLLWYTQSPEHRWNQPYKTLTEAEIEAKYPFVDSDGRRWQSVTLRNPGVRPNLHYPYRASNGITYQPHPNGWSCNIERMRKYDSGHRLHYPKGPTGALRLKMYADESPGEKLQNIWEDIPPISALARERLGYPTQKPEALLERIVKASSSEGDLVLDPFCGCGTTIQVAQRLNRQWIGIDITHIAIGLIKKRLSDAFGEGVRESYQVVGEPTDLAGATKLAEEDKFQFQWWALGLMGGRPAEQKKGADRGVDGRIYFHDDRAGATKQIVFSVKAGEHLTPAFVRDLSGVVERERAQMGVLITLKRPTREMLKDASSYGFYESRWGKHPRIQIVTIEQLLGGHGIDRPPTEISDATMKKGARSVPVGPPEQMKLLS